MSILRLTRFIVIVAFNAVFGLFSFLVTTFLIIDNTYLMIDVAYVHGR